MTTKIADAFLIFSFLFLVLCSGCVGVHNCELSGLSAEISTEKLAEALTGKSASVTLMDGTMYKGRITHVEVDSLTMYIEEPCDTVIAEKGIIYAISVPECFPCWIAGAAVGGVIGGLATPKKHASSALGEWNGADLRYGAAGIFLGGELVAFLTPPERYVFGPAPELLDTLRVDKKDVISNTREQITVRQAQESTTYDKRLVKAVTHDDYVLVIHPATSLIRPVRAHSAP